MREQDSSTVAGRSDPERGSPTAPRVLEDQSSIMGKAAAALVAAGIGSFAIGLMTTLAEASAGLSSALNIINPVGPLSGKTIVTLVIWLISWAILHSAWKDHDRPFSGVYTTTLVLIALGLLGTFPIFFDLFAP